MQEVNPTTNLDRDLAGPRLLSKDVYNTYSMEDRNQANLYKRLAKFVKQQQKETSGAFFIESLSPGSYDEAGLFYFTLIITASV